MTFPLDEKQLKQALEHDAAQRESAKAGGKPQPPPVVATTIEGQLRAEYARRCAEEVGHGHYAPPDIRHAMRVQLIGEIERLALNPQSTFQLAMALARLSIFSATIDAGR